MLNGINKRKAGREWNKISWRVLANMYMLPVRFFSQYACTYTYVHILVYTCFCTNSYWEKYLTDEVALESVKILTPWMKENQRNLFKNFCSTNWWKKHQFSCWVVSYFLQPHGLQHARLLCPSLLPRVFSNSCPLSQWCCPTISSSVISSSSLQTFPASWSFSMNQFFPSGDQSVEASASTSVLPKNIQGWFSLGLI